MTPDPKSDCAWPCVSSMTGFARLADGRVSWELRSVNGRGLEINVLLPRLLSDLEPEVRTVMRSELIRGNIHASLEVVSEDASRSMDVDLDAVAKLAEAERLVAAQAPELRRMSTADLLNWPGVLARESNSDTSELRCHALRTLQRTVKELRLHRLREGKGLASTIYQRLDAICSLVSSIQEQSENQSELVRTRLVARLERLNVSVDSGRIEQEVALFASKADVSEELDRLDLHVAEFRECMAGSPPHGKRLGFLTQELQREANTLGAKVAVSECASLVVDLKMAIDQIREQAANLE